MLLSTLVNLFISGHPLKIHKRSAVIRFMFFNTEDVLHFKSVKLRTKMGRFGHIKEPLGMLMVDNCWKYFITNVSGTHGHMKCIFNGQLKQQDTVFMHLYKRVYPKWNYENLVATCVDTSSIEMEWNLQKLLKCVIYVNKIWQKIKWF